MTVDARVADSWVVADPARGPDCARSVHTRIVVVNHGTSRERILDATRKCLADEGILGLKIADVCVRAGVSVTSIYRYFTNRDLLVGTTLLEMLTDSLTELTHTVSLTMSNPAYLQDKRQGLDDEHPRSMLLSAIEEACGPDHHQLCANVVAACAYDTDLRERLAQLLCNFKHTLHERINELENTSPQGDALRQQLLVEQLFEEVWPLRVFVPLSQETR